MSNSNGSKEGKRRGKVFAELLCDFMFKRLFGSETNKDAEKRGLERGLAESEAKGRQEGLAEGEARGRSEAQAEMARNLKALGVDIETIIKATGIERETIEGL